MVGKFGGQVGYRKFDVRKKQRNVKTQNIETKGSTNSEELLQMTTGLENTSNDTRTTFQRKRNEFAICQLANFS